FRPICYLRRQRAQSRPRIGNRGRAVRCVPVCRPRRAGPLPGARVIIDRGHLRWGLATGLLAATSTALYVSYSRTAPSGPSGGSWQGLVFGLAGFSLMTFAALLGARKKVRTWRLGRASTWLKGHLWLGLLSVPLILYHGGFARGGPL